MKKIRTIKAAVLEEKKLRVCAYARVSTDQLDQQNSLSAQVEHYTNHIKNNPTWDFAGIYCDDGISGKSKAKRPSVALPEVLPIVMRSVNEKKL